MVVSLQPTLKVSWTKKFYVRRNNKEDSIETGCRVIGYLLSRSDQEKCVYITHHAIITI